MQRLLVFCAAVLAISLAAPTDEPSLFTKILKEHKDLLPSEVVEAYKNLSPEEKNDLKEVFKNYKNYKNEKELIAALKEKNPELGAKAEKLNEKLQKKIEGLGEEPKEFVTTLIAGGRGLYARTLDGEKIGRSEIKALIETTVTAYKALSAEAREDFKKTFGGVAKFFEDDKAQSLIAKLLEKEDKKNSQ